MTAHAALYRCQRLNRRAWDRVGAVRLAVRRKFGYRGLILLMFGLIYVSIGLSVIGAHDYRQELVHTHLPVPVRVLIWCIPGVVSAVVSADGKWQTLGFGLLFLPPAERAVSYFVAVVTVPTWQRLPAVLVYVLVLVTVTMVAAWPEPVEVDRSMVAAVKAQHFEGLPEGGATTIADENLYVDALGELFDPDAGRDR